MGVYNADGTVMGELGYWLRARVGRADCSLCKITHGSVREKGAWRECRDGLGVAFDTYHRNDQPSEVRVVTGDVLPAVLAETAAGMVLLLSRDALNRCQGSIEALAAALTEAADRHGLALNG